MLLRGQNHEKITHITIIGDALRVYAELAGGTPLQKGAHAGRQVPSWRIGNRPFPTGPRGMGGFFIKY
jgi:hypothetical protein